MKSVFWKSYTSLACLVVFLLSTSCQTLADGKLIGTSGAAQVEGSAGGGIVPWAIIAGNGTQDQFGGAAHASLVEVDDLFMSSYGVALGVYDRYEVSLGRISAQNKINADVLRQNVLGFKARIMGDLIFSHIPQIALGLQYKKIDTSSDLSGIPFDRDSGLDTYLAATKVWLDGFWHRNVLLNVTLRYSKANQLGLLGYGSENGTSNSGDLLIETSAAVFLNRHWIVGVEYRQKPNNLEGIPEDDWYDVFVSFVPDSSLALVLAYMNTGRVGGSDEQHGIYLSIKGAF